MLNGESRELAAGMSVADLLRELGLHARTVVVEHNREILPRDLFSSALVQSGDTLELVHFVGGG
jgi:thiamine biosynthesis protein ThiS